MQPDLKPTEKQLDPLAEAARDPDMQEDPKKSIEEEGELFNGISDRC